MNWTVIIVAGMACFTAIFITSLIVGARPPGRRTRTPCSLPPA